MIESIKPKLEQITAANGCLFDVREVSAGDSPKLRGIAIEEQGGGCLLHLNATGKTLELLRGYVLDLLVAEYEVSGDGPLTVTPKNRPKPSRRKSGGETRKGADDAAIETT